jgi:hypothetical protein
MNNNKIITEEFSNPESEAEYLNKFPSDPKARDLAEECHQCGGCSYYAVFNSDYGLCCNPASKHHLETVFEHFTCSQIDIESWDYHSFGTGEIVTRIPESQLDEKIWQVAENAVNALQSEQYSWGNEDVVKAVYLVLDSKVKSFLKLSTDS